MPALGNGVESCLIASWLIKEGDTIAENGILCEVGTDKASMEVPSAAPGAVLELLWTEGDDVPVKQPLLVVGGPGGDPAPVLVEVGFGATQEETPEQATVVTAEPPGQVPTSAPVASDEHGSSPRVYSLAATEGTDITIIPMGTGPGGRVITHGIAIVAGTTTKVTARTGAVAGEGTGLGDRVSQADLTAPAAPAEEIPTSAPAAVRGADPDFPGPSTNTPLRGIHKVVSEWMMHPLASSMQLTYTVTTRVQGLLDTRKKLRNFDPALGLSKVTIGGLVRFAAVGTTARYPTHNAHLEDRVLTTSGRVHLGSVCDTSRSPLVLTVRNASQSNLGQFSAICKDLAVQAIRGTISLDLLGGATFTVSNLGGSGIEHFTPLLNVPQIVILGIDAIPPCAYADEKGKIRVEQRIGLSPTAGHRVIDGIDVAHFLQDLAAFLEDIELTVLS